MNQLELQDNRKLWGLGEVLMISVPASMSMLNGVVMRFVDGVIVGHLGPDKGPIALTAQMQGAMMSFVPEAMAMGILTVVNTYVSQNIGAGRRMRCGQYAWAGVLMGLLLGMIIASSAFLAGSIFSPFGHSADVFTGETMFYRYMVVGSIMTLPSRALESFFFGTGRSLTVFIATLIANAFNIVAAIGLVYGKWGLPRMELEGSALATFLSFGLQLIILLGIFLLPHNHKQYGTWLVRATKWRQCKDILKIGWPAGVTFCNDVFTWAMFLSVLIATFNAAHQAATSIVFRWLPVSFMPTVGIGIAATALVGKYIGAGRTDIAKRRARAAMLAAVVYMGICAAMFVLFRHPMIQMFLSEETAAATTAMSAAQAAELNSNIIRIGGTLMILAAIFQLSDALAIIYIGALRGAGDTFVPMIITIILSWTVNLGGGLMMVHFLPQLESAGPWITSTAFLVILGMAMAWRFESGAWRKIDLLGVVTPQSPAKQTDNSQPTQADSSSSK